MTNERWKQQAMSQETTKETDMVFLLHLFKQLTIYFRYHACDKTSTTNARGERRTTWTNEGMGIGNEVKRLKTGVSFLFLVFNAYLLTFLFLFRYYLLAPPLPPTLPPLNCE
jgi:hypothetical protein